MLVEFLVLGLASPWSLGYQLARSTSPAFVQPATVSQGTKGETLKGNFWGYIGGLYETIEGYIGVPSRGPSYCPLSLRIKQFGRPGSRGLGLRGSGV